MHGLVSNRMVCGACTRALARVRLRPCPRAEDMWAGMAERPPQCQARAQYPQYHDRYLDLEGCVLACRCRGRSVLAPALQRNCMSHHVPSCTIILHHVPSCTIMLRLPSCARACLRCASSPSACTPTCGTKHSSSRAASQASLRWENPKPFLKTGACPALMSPLLHLVQV